MFAYQFLFNVTLLLHYEYIFYILKNIQPTIYIIFWLLYDRK